MHFNSSTINIRTDIQNLSDRELLEQTEHIAQHERGITILSLRHLREVQIRRAYVEQECSSMYAYCIKKLKYSENETQTRLSSARLLIELPEIEAKIESGSLNMTNLSKAQTFIRAEKGADSPLSREEKIALLEQSEDMTTREFAKDLVRRSRDPAVLAEKLHVTAVVMEDETLNLDFQKFEVLLNTEDQSLLQEFKNLYAHELSDQSNLAILRSLLKKAVAVKRKKLGIENSTVSSETSNNAPPPMSPKETSPEEVRVPPVREVIPAEVRRQLWQRANAQCEHKDHLTNIRCESKFALQPDHVKPVALGGTNELENLQLLCRNHNSRRAIKTFGVRRN